MLAVFGFGNEGLAFEAIYPLIVRFAYTGYNTLRSFWRKYHWLCKSPWPIYKPDVSFLLPVHIPSSKTCTSPDSFVEGLSLACLFS